MSNSYCTHIDLIRYGNTARLLSQLASPDHGVIPTAEEVQNYFLNGISTADNVDNLRSIKSRVEQAIKNGAGEINGWLTLCRTQNAGFTLPSETLATANMDLALFRLFPQHDEDSTTRLNAQKWTTLFDKVATGKVATASTNAGDSGNTETTTVAETVQTTATVWTEEALNGY